MLFFSNKNIFIKAIYTFSLLSIFLLFTSAVKANENFSAVFRDLTKDEETRRKKIGEDKLLILSYNGVTKKEFVIIDHLPSSMPFAKTVMCGNTAYPTVLIKRIEKDKQEKYIERNFLMIYNHLLDEIAFHQESVVVSNQLTDSPDKFEVTVQPKFTLDTVEAFVCSSQVNLCKANEELEKQCTFSDGRQANMCNDGSGYLANILRISKSSKELEKEHRVQTLLDNQRYRAVQENSKGGLSGISNTVSFTVGDIDYSFENHWSTRSRDDYDFHAEFNIRKEGKIIENHDCLEGSYE